MKKNKIAKITPFVLCFTAALFCLIMGVFVLIYTKDVSSMLSYKFLTWGGKSEFLTFYGGFYIGIGVFLLISSFVKRYTEAALLFLSLSSLGALIVRSTALLINDVESIFYQLLIGELILLIAGAVGFLLEKRKSN